MLTPRKRLTKKDLKEDKLVTFYYQAQSWLDENSRYVYMGLGAVVVVLIAVFFITSSRQKAEEAASVDLAIALRSFSADQYEQAKPLLNSLVDNYSSTTSGELGMFYLATAMFKTNDYSEALNYYSEFVSKFKGDEFIKSSAMSGIAACYEQMGQYQEAAVQYEKTGKKYADDFAAPGYFFKAARCFQLAGNEEQANVLFAKIIQDYPDSEVRNDALLMKSVM